MTHGSAIRTPFDAPAFGRALAQGRWKVTVVNPSTPDPAALEGQDDAALVAACVSGRREAFDAIVERHRRTVYLVCYRFVGNHEDASDLSQEAFVRAWRGLNNFKGQSQLSTWLYRIAVNVCLNKVSAKTPANWPRRNSISFLPTTRVQPSVRTRPP